jgi:hypothetical protein
VLYLLGYVAAAHAGNSDHEVTVERVAVSVYFWRCHGQQKSPRNWMGGL